MTEKREAVRIVLVEDHGIVRAAIKRALLQIPWVEIVGEAGDGVSAIQLIATLKPDLVILDLILPGREGMEIIQEAKRRSAGTNIIVLTSLQNGTAVKRAMMLGADAYVLKAGGWQDLEHSIMEVLSGHRYVSPAASLLFHDGLCSPSVGRITCRERQVLKLLAEGHTNQKIAAILGISVKTVDRHRENIMQKLGVRTPVALAAIALREGLVVE